MAFEPGGMSDKLGNRYEGRWVAKQLLRLLKEEILLVTVELIGPEEEGVDLQIVKKDTLLMIMRLRCQFKIMRIIGLWPYGSRRLKFSLLRSNQAHIRRR